MDYFMKKLISMKWQKEWRYLWVTFRGSRNWCEFRFSVSFNGIWSRTTRREDGSLCSCTGASITFLWWSVGASLWI